MLLNNSDKDAYAEIYQRFKGILFIHAYRLLREKEEAKDVVQEIFARLWTKREQLNLTVSLSSYLYAAVRNKIFDLIARKKVETEYISSLQTFISQGDMITDQLVREKELRAIIEGEIAALPPKMREVFELSRKGNLTHRQIAEKLGLSEKTVKKQVNNALKMLRLKLGVFTYLIYFL
ncbi:RNA polymerase sigma-70 factor [Chitinophaga costaii]|nr:RNA polymerase sigma-70 factor [Chitinophaga costaii]